ncbi:branched-chain amino acid transport system II carrier protein [Campylobacter sp. VBCF_06 NA8]|uniref:branched-chain amino acid transport system II carrier protein n=1 Tax=Campylobacter sp. VBCF_06 NA8 TaxID=2983822 RepID=UPI0022E9EAF9|nr:branched-chain amino acid transport system II carrier protein [Campylobacter sp. VBCF_06 NA8]MDA3046308.1 branched-chain amino acid transport system II carrier protein [Campylobacter sp. VBCF_06 NA8]
MDRKLTKKEFFTIALMLFAMYFGAGNFIFPPIVGKNAGDNFFVGIMFFCCAAILIPVLGVAAVAKSKGLANLVERVDPVFALIFTVALYLTIGPLFAIPRAANMPFDIVVRENVAETSVQMWLLIYSAAYFALNFVLCLNPSKLVDLLGRYLTPVLLILILGLFVSSFFTPMGEFVAPNEAYRDHAVASGFVDGYQTMDALASLAFGIIIANAMRARGVSDEGHIVVSMIKAGMFAGALLAVIYLMISYLGASAASLFPDVTNGAQYLSKISHYLFGSVGTALLGLAFFLACLTTTLGLISSCSQYFENLVKGKIPYKAWVVILCFVSFGVANFGLTTIISASIPVLIAIYPAAIMLIILSLIDPLIDTSKLVYRACVYASFAVGIVNGLDVLKIKIPGITNWVSSFPFYDAMLGWIVPSVVAFVISFLIHILTKKSF